MSRRMGVCAVCVAVWGVAPANVSAQAASGAPATVAAAPAGGPDLAEFIRLYTTETSDVSRFHDMAWSEAAFDRREAAYAEWASRLEREDFDRLGQEGRVEYVLLRNEIGAEKARLSMNRARLAEMDAALPFRAVIQDLERSRRSMEAVNAEDAATKVAGIAAQVKAVRERVEKGRKPAEAGGAAGAEEKDGPIRLSPVLARRAAGAVDAIRGTLWEWFAFYDGYKPEFSWWLRKPYGEASAALEEYARYLRAEVAGLKGEADDPLIGDPIGRDALIEDLAREVIPYTPEEIIAIGEGEFAWCEAQVRIASAEMGFKDDWKAALAKVKADHVPPGEQDAFVAKESRDAIRFVKEHDLVTVPPLCEETWRLTMISPDGQRTLPFAAYGGQNMMVAYPTDAMKNDDKQMSMRGNNRSFTHIVTPHELIPGHHLQRFVWDRARPYRGIFSTPFATEGWCLYWETRLWDLGYGRTPEERLGMLFWRMHRCARIVVSLKFHLGQMTPQEMVDYLVDRVGHEKFGATSEVRRFIGGDYSPLYQAGYMIGGLQIRALRKEMVESGKMGERPFNDAVISSNSIPIEMVRAGMEGLPLARDTKASWRFAGSLAEPGKP